MTDRQKRWERAARIEAHRGNEVAAALFALIAEPSDHEREHSCIDHSTGFSRKGRRGFKCGICGTVVKWVDPERDSET